jgi:hypothetical protein
MRPSRTVQTSRPRMGCGKAGEVQVHDDVTTSPATSTRSTVSRRSGGAVSHDPRRTAAIAGRPWCVRTSTEKGSVYSASSANSASSAGPPSGPACMARK